MSPRSRSLAPCTGEPSAHVRVSGPEPRPRPLAAKAACSALLCSVSYHGNSGADRAGSGMATVESPPVEPEHRCDDDPASLSPHSADESCLPSPAPSDLLKIGFFKTDRATQTEVSDILELKELSTAIETLGKDRTILQRKVDINILSLQADYQMKLEEKCTYLYKRMNEQNFHLKKKYIQRIDILRNSFRQQLTNAMSKINAEYKKYCRELCEKNKMSIESSNTTLLLLKQKDLIILSLKEKISECESSGRLDIDFDGKDADDLLIVNQELRNEVNSLNQETEKNAKTIILKENQIKELEKEIEILKHKSDNIVHSMQKLVQSETNLKRALDNEIHRGKQMLELQRVKMDSMFRVTLLKMEESEESSKVHLSPKEKESELSHQTGTSSSIEIDSATEKKQKTQSLDNEQLKEELKNLRKKYKEQRKIIDDYNKHGDRTNRMWEKKFAILKQSYHAIKDEMFLRCSFQRQAPMLHRAFARYSVIGDPGVDFRPSHNMSPYFTLPQIGTQSAPQTAQTKHNVDRPTSAPSSVNLSTEGEHQPVDSMSTSTKQFHRSPDNLC